jgi:diguanylate cyclase (GGDEF)-like protein
LWWERLEAIKAEGVTEEFLVGVLFVDLDGFKRVNDGHGHATGDHVLVETARRLLGVLAPLGDDAFTVRLSGDEFAILLVREPAKQCATIAEALLDAIKRPIDVNGVPVRVGASVGIATTSSRVLNPSALLRAADEAMYRVKRRGKGGVEVMGDDTPTREDLPSSLTPTTGWSGRHNPKDSWKRA